MLIDYVMLILFSAVTVLTFSACDGFIEINTCECE
jgi:hypothetical protein